MKKRQAERDRGRTRERANQPESQIETGIGQVTLKDIWTEPQRGMQREGNREGEVGVEEGRQG